MTYADAILARLADPAARGAIFAGDALRRILAAAYQDDLIQPRPPFAAVFEELRLGVASPRVCTLDGTWNPVGGVERTEARFSVSGLTGEGVGADAMWRGAIGASVQPFGDRIEQVESEWPDADRAELTVTFSPPADTPRTTRAIPLEAAIFVRGADEFSLRELLGQSKTARERLLVQGFGRAAERSLPGRHPLTVIWILPPAVFDDADWPGGDGGGTPEAQREARLGQAAAFLAIEGIGLVTAPAP